MIARTRRPLPQSPGQTAAEYLLSFDPPVGREVLVPDNSSPVPTADPYSHTTIGDAETKFRFPRHLTTDCPVLDDDNHPPPTDSRRRSRGRMKAHTTNVAMTLE